MVPARVLYLHHVAERSGAENSLRLLISNVDRASVTPLFAGPSRGPFPESLARVGVPVHPVAFGPLRDLPGLVRAVIGLRRLVRQERLDLLHANGPQTNVPAGLAGRLAGVPVVWHARNLLADGMRDVDRMLAALPTRIVCNSDAIRQRFAGSRAWDKSLTIPNAVDTTEFHPGVSGLTFRREHGIPDGEPVVGLVGRVGRGKGHQHFVDAALTLLASGVRAHFLIVGDTLFREDAWRTEALRRRIKDGGGDDRIRFTGYRSDMPEVMRGLDVLVLASDAEPCGRVLFEAMASGTAIVATASGGTPEIVRNGVEALLVPPRAPAALATALATLVSDPSLRARLGRAGVDRVRARFTVARHVTATQQVYADALAAWGARR